MCVGVCVVCGVCCVCVCCVCVCVCVLCVVVCVCVCVVWGGVCVCVCGRKEGKYPSMSMDHQGCCLFLEYE